MFVFFLKIDLGDRLLQGFNHRSKIPFSDVNLGLGKASAPRWGPDSSTSEVTTIQLEFRELSHVAGDPRYKVINYIYNRGGRGGGGRGRG